MIGNQDAHARGDQPTDFALEFLYGTDRPAKRLIQQDQRGVGDHRARSLCAARRRKGTGPAVGHQPGKPFYQIMGSPSLSRLIAIVSRIASNSPPQSSAERRWVPATDTPSPAARLYIGSLVISLPPKITPAVRNNHPNHPEGGGFAGSLRPADPQSIAEAQQYALG